MRVRGGDGVSGVLLTIADRCARRSAQDFCGVRSQMGDAVSQLRTVYSAIKHQVAPQLTLIGDASLWHAEVAPPSATGRDNSHDTTTADGGGRLHAEGGGKVGPRGEGKSVRGERESQSEGRGKVSLRGEGKSV